MTATGTTRSAVAGSLAGTLIMLIVSTDATLTCGRLEGMSAVGRGRLTIVGVIETMGMIGVGRRTTEDGKLIEGGTRGGEGRNSVADFSPLTFVHF